MKSRTAINSLKLMGLSIFLINSVLGCTQVSFAPSASPESLQNGEGTGGGGGAGGGGSGGGGSGGGTNPTTKTTDSFFFENDGNGAKVDVLFIIDNSASMVDEQVKLGGRLSSFISSLDKIDWQIGITTTDVSGGIHGLQGSLVQFKGTNTKILTKSVPGFEQIFADTVYRDESINCGVSCPSNDERPMEAIIGAMTKHNTMNTGFFRPDADLATVVLSDEDERSYGPVGSTEAQTVFETFTSIWGNTNKHFSSYGIIVQPGDVNCYNEQYNSGGTYGDYAANLAALTGGLTGSICNNDYGPALADIGNRVRDIATTISLSKEPMALSVEVEVIPADPTLTWTVIDKTVRFNHHPKKGTTVKISYFPK